MARDLLGLCGTIFIFKKKEMVLKASRRRRSSSQNFLLLFCNFENCLYNDILELGFKIIQQLKNHYRIKNQQIFLLNECETEHLLKFHSFHSLDAFKTECVILFHSFLTNPNRNQPKESLKTNSPLAFAVCIFEMFENEEKYQ